jgi:hypothetical protein
VVMKAFTPGRGALRSLDEVVEDGGGERLEVGEVDEDGAHAGGLVRGPSDEAPPGRGQCGEGVVERGEMDGLGGHGHRV